MVVRNLGLLRGPKYDHGTTPRVKGSFGVERNKPLQDHVG